MVDGVMYESNKAPQMTCKLNPRQFLKAELDCFESLRTYGDLK